MGVVIRDQREQNNRLCHKVAEYERKSAVEKLASCDREAVLNYRVNIASPRVNIASGEIEADLRDNNYFREAGCFGIESWCKESFWFVKLLRKILKLALQTIG